MSVSIVRGTSTKPAAVDQLVELFAKDSLLEGTLSVGYPNLGGDANEANPEALWLSPEFGAVLFDVVEGTDLGDYEQRQDDIFRLYHARLMRHRELVKRRQLITTPQILTFAPGVATPPDGLPDSVANAKNLIERLAALDHEDLDDETYRKLVSAAQSVSSIRKSRQTRVVEKDDSRGAKLLAVENSIATLDNSQQRAVIETVDGVQRIRGLAGSGKTIILALKVAYLHGRHPDWRIAVTFYTRSLKEQFKRLITTFCLEQNSAEPDWDRIQIVNAWGGRGGADRTGIYKQFCDVNGLVYYDFQSAKAEFPHDPFKGVVELALVEVEDPKPVYDVILVDEAQDFPAAFLRMCYEMLTEPHRLVYAYDELQSLTGSGVPEPEEIFGKDEQGNPRVSLATTAYDLGARRDVVLEKCYRNSRPVLVAAHAVGFGIYRTPEPQTGTGLVQMFGKPERWRDIGYHVSDGELVAGKHVRLARSPESSPKFLEDHSSVSDLIECHVFASTQEQNQWVAEQIKKNLDEDELRYDDIMVISPNPFTARANLGPLRRILLELGVDNHLAGVDQPADHFFAPNEDSVTFTGINRAKGNEAGMVYIVNAQEELSQRSNQAVVRNRLFTAITRSKAWVRVCGVGDAMEALAQELTSVADTRFELDFTYPTEDQLKRLRIVHREVSPAARESIVDKQETMRSLFAQMQKGEIVREDLDPDVLEGLRNLLESEG